MSEICFKRYQGNKKKTPGTKGMWKVTNETRQTKYS